MFLALDPVWEQNQGPDEKQVSKWGDLLEEQIIIFLMATVAVVELALNLKRSSMWFVDETSFSLLVMLKAFHFL